MRLSDPGYKTGRPTPRLLGPVNTGKMPHYWSCLWISHDREMPPRPDATVSHGDARWDGGENVGQPQPSHRPPTHGWSSGSSAKSPMGHDRRWHFSREHPFSFRLRNHKAPSENPLVGLARRQDPNQSGGHQGSGSGGIEAGVKTDRGLPHTLVWRPFRSPWSRLARRAKASSRLATRSFRLPLVKWPSRPRSPGSSPVRRRIPWSTVCTA